MGFNERTFEEQQPPNQIALQESSAMGCNWRTSEYLSPNQNRHLRVGHNELYWKNFCVITSLIKLKSNSALQWTAMRGILRTYSYPPPPQKKICLKERAAVCGNGRTFEELTP